MMVSQPSPSEFQRAYAAEKQRVRADEPKVEVYAEQTYGANNEDIRLRSRRTINSSVIYSHAPSKSANYFNQ